MELTKRQCWKVIRQLVSAKNKEYREFLNVTFNDLTQTRQIQGYTRDVFLKKYGIYSLNEFFELYKKRTGSEPDRKDWIENLGSESLLIFLDFRCRALQEIYDYYLKYNNISKNVIEKITTGTKLSPLAKFKLSEKNKIELMYSRKPSRLVGGEKKLSQLNMSDDELSEQALAQTMSELASGYMTTQDESSTKAVELCQKLVTTNLTYRNEKRGYQYRGIVKIEPKQYEMQESKSSKEDKVEPSKQSNSYIIGFDKNRMPIFIRNGKQVNLIGNLIPDEVVVYDIHYNPIINFSDAENFIGIDIEGRPVYEYEGDYYNSLGERLPDDTYIQTGLNDGFER